MCKNTNPPASISFPPKFKFDSKLLKSDMSFISLGEHFIFLERSKIFLKNPARKEAAMPRKRKEVCITWKLVGGPGPKLMAFVEDHGWGDINFLKEEQGRVFLIDLHIKARTRGVFHGMYDMGNGNHRFEMIWDPVKESGSLTVFSWEE